MADYRFVNSSVAKKICASGAKRTASGKMHLFANAAVEKSCEAAPAPCVGHCQAAASPLKNEAEKLHGRHFDEHVPTCASKTKRVEDRNNRVRVEEGGRAVEGGRGLREGAE